MTTFPRFHAILSRARVFTVALFTATGLGLVAQAAVGPTCTFSTLAGRAGVAGFTDGAGTVAEFTTPLGVAVDAFGVVYVADTLGHTIRRISPDGVVTTLAGKGGVLGYVDGPVAASRFNFPSGIVVDGAGCLYVADFGNAVIRKITGAGEVTTLAGVVGEEAVVDGAGRSARFRRPCALASDAVGNLYVFDDQTVRKVTPSGEVTTLAGEAGARGIVDGQGKAARFGQVYGLAVDGAGNLYATECANHVIRKITPSGEVTTLAGKANDPATVDGQGGAARFASPMGLAIDGAGNLFVGEASGALRRISPSGEVTTVGGKAGDKVVVDGIGAAVRFAGPTVITVDGGRRLFLADGHTIRKGVPALSGTSQFAALSARAQAGTGEQTLILGFAFAGGGKPTLIRGVGPGLVDADASLAGLVMADPQVELHESQGSAMPTLATNDNWGGAAGLRSTFARVGAGALRESSKDAAMVQSLTRTAYTAHVTDVGGARGVVLAEAYDAELADTTKRLAALSVRNQVGTGAQVLIAGFVLTGDAPRRVIVRGVGPGLTGQVSGYLADPVVQLHRLHSASGQWQLVAENDNWDGSASLAAAFKAAGMGALTAGSKDAAMIVDLEPGIYTAQVSGAGATEGVALVEIYEAP